MKYLKIFLFLFMICFSIELVNANVICNDGTESPSCGACYQGCCSHHGGCSNSYNNLRYSSSSSSSGGNTNNISDDNKSNDNDESDKDDNHSTYFVIALLGLIMYLKGKNYYKKSYKEYRR